MIRTLLFFVLIYFLVKFVSRLFLPSSNNNRRGGANFMFRTFQRMAENQQRNSQNQNQKSGSGNTSKQFEEIEEAEYEEITEEDSTGSSRPD